MGQLFKKMPSAEKGTVRYEIRLSGKDAEIIRASALVRNLSVAEFMRRAALGRRADIRYETEIVLTLRDVVQSVRMLHAAYVSDGIVPQTEIWEMIISEAKTAMLRISK